MLISRFAIISGTADMSLFACVISTLLAVADGAAPTSGDPGLRAVVRCLTAANGETTAGTLSPIFVSKAPDVSVLRQNINIHFRQ